MTNHNPVGYAFAAALWCTDCMSEGDVKAWRDSTDPCFHDNSEHVPQALFAWEEAASEGTCDNCLKPLLS